MEDDCLRLLFFLYRPSGLRDLEIQRHRRTDHEHLTFGGPYIVTYSYNKTNEMH